MFELTLKSYTIFNWINFVEISTNFRLHVRVSGENLRNRRFMQRCLSLLSILIFISIKLCKCFQNQLRYLMNGCCWSVIVVYSTTVPLKSHSNVPIWTVKTSCNVVHGVKKKTYLACMLNCKLILRGKVKSKFYFSIMYVLSYYLLIFWMRYF